MVKKSQLSSLISFAEQEHGYANTFTVPKATNKLVPPLLPPINGIKNSGSNNTTSVIVSNRRQRGKKGQGNR